MEVDIPQIITRLESIKARPRMYVGNHGAQAIGSLLWGFQMGLFFPASSREAEQFREIKSQIISERGWRCGNYSLETTLMKSGWEDERIIEEVLTVEIETWRRAESLGLFNRHFPDIGIFISREFGLIGEWPCVCGVPIPWIVLHHKQGWTEAKISEHYPKLPIAQVYAALAYYYSHKAEIEICIANAKEKLTSLIHDQTQHQSVREWASKELPKYEY